MKKPEGLKLKEVGARLRAARKALGLTIDGMYHKTGFSRSLISDAENGLKKPSSIYLFYLLDLFNVNINYIFKCEGSMFLPKIEIKGDFGADTEKVSELIKLMENLDLVRYEMLSHFIKFKTENRKVIEELIKEKNRETKLDS